MTYDEMAVLVANEGNDIVYIADPLTYELYYLNRTALQLFGYQEDGEWKGRPCYRILQNEDQPCAFCTNALLTERDFYVWEHYNDLLNRHFTIKDKLIDLDGKKVRLEIAVDTTEKEHAAGELRRKLHAEETLISCIQTLNENEDIGQAINHLLEIIGKYHEAERAYIFELDFENRRFNNTYEWCDTGIDPQKQNLQNLPFEAANRWFEQFEHSGEFYITSLKDSVDQSSLEFEILDAQGIESLMAAPLLLQNKIVGFLGVDNPSQNTDTMTLLRSVASFVINDINKRKLMEQLTILSYTDSLTGQGNRHRYTRKLQLLEETPPSSLGIIFIDINGLKLANDAHGHQYGDSLIVHTSDTLRSIFHRDIYRIGGDEFIVFCTDMDKSLFEEKVGRLRELSEGDDELNISIGSSWSSGDYDISHQVSHTDDLMYIDKQTYYGRRSSDTGKYRSGLTRRLVDEISAGLFVVHLQPKVELKSGTVIGAEALVRKKDEDGKLIPPARFIPRYETEGIVRYVDLFVFETICEMLSQWKQKQFKEIRISVNLSRVTLLEHDIPWTLRRLCEKYGISPSLINIEVTESIGTMEKEELQELIQALEQVGFTISLDDFGSEYSSLSILSSMNFDEIKLDKSLIDNLEHSRKSRIITEHAIELCRDLSLTVSVAEGIESPGQLDVLETLNCSVGQGYYFDKPMPIEEFVEKYIRYPG